MAVPRSEECAGANDERLCGYRRDEPLRHELALPVDADGVCEVVFETGPAEQPVEDQIRGEGEQGDAIVLACAREIGGAGGVGGHAGSHFPLGFLDADESGGIDDRPGTHPLDRCRDRGRVLDVERRPVGGGLATALRRDPGECLAQRPGRPGNEKGRSAGASGEVSTDQE